MNPATTGDDWMSDNGKHFAWRIVQVLCSVLLAGVTITTPMVVSAVSNIHEATHALSERVTAVEQTRLTVTEAHKLQRQIDAKADMIYCAEQWAGVTAQLNTIHAAVTRLEVLVERSPP